jgi:hypothetical protein
MLEKSVVWFALGMIVAGAIGAVTFLEFLSKRVKAEIETPETTALIAKKAAELNPQAIPRGSLVLFGGRCPQGWEDLTATMNGRYVFIDQSSVENVQLYEDDGSHSHEGGSHTHDVSGRTGPLGGGERSGGNDRHAAHKDNTTTITGTASAEKSSHTHTGGVHHHKRIGVRLCKA